MSCRDSLHNSSSYRSLRDEYQELVCLKKMTQEEVDRLLGKQIINEKKSSYDKKNLLRSKFTSCFIEK